MVLSIDNISYRLHNVLIKTYEGLKLKHYLIKKSKTKQRGIAFDLSEEEYKFFMQLKDDRTSRCAYTNKTFIFKDNHPQQPSLERLDDRGPYSLTNCVIVTRTANQLKDMLDKGIDKEKAKLTQEQKNLLIHIENIMKDPEWKQKVWNNQVKPYLERVRYKHLLPKETTQMIEQQVETQSESQDKAPEDDTTPIQNTTKPVIAVENDIDLAAEYVSLGRMLQNNGVGFTISFSEFKSLMLRKKCQLTNKIFSETDTKSLYFIDKTQPASKNTCLVTTKEVQEALDKLFVSVKLSHKELKQMFKTLGGK